MRGAARWRAERQKAPQRRQRDAAACLGAALGHTRWGGGRLA